MIEGWHVWLGGTAAAGILIGAGKWGYSVLNGKADRTTVKALFTKVDDNTDDIAELKTNVAVTMEKTKNIKETVDKGDKRMEKMDGKLDELLGRPAPPAL